MSGEQPRFEIEPMAAPDPSLPYEPRSERGVLTVRIRFTFGMDRSV